MKINQKKLLSNFFNLSNSSKFVFFAILLLGSLSYFNSFSVPLVFDDSFVFENRVSVKNLDQFLEQNGPKTQRAFAYFTFALNYHLHQADVFGYHLVNFIIHITTSFLLWKLTFLLLNFSTSFQSVKPKHKKTLALIVSLIFLLHPIQTQAVTYISQRFASLATLFYISTFIYYLKARHLNNLPKSKKNLSLRNKHLLTSAGLAIAALYSKETAVTIPITILGYELIINKTNLFKNPKYLLPIFTALLFSIVVALTTTSYSFLFQPKKNQIGEIITSHTYLLTQLKAFPKYMQLIVLPVNQNIDHYVPIAKHFTQPDVIAGFIVVSILLSLLFVLLKTSRLISFSIFWFLVTLSVESSIFPIEDVFFEHRLYLPMVGVSIAIVMSAYHLSRNKISIIFLSAFALILLSLGSLTILRNNVWSSPFRLWSDAVSKAPLNPRPHVNLGVQYQLLGETTNAINHYQIAIALDPTSPDAYNNLGVIALAKKDYKLAQERFRVALEHEPDNQDFQKNLNIALIGLANNPANNNDQ